MDDDYTLAIRAFIWGYPLVRAAQLRLNTTRPDDPRALRAATVAGAPLGSMGHARALSTPDTRLGVAPNNDTLYSLAWLDLCDEPFVLECPDFGDRYYTFQMGQADSSTEQSIGQRSHGRRLPPVFIHGPSYRGRVPDGMVNVGSNYRYLMIAGRILANGSADLPAVHALQDRVRLRTWTAYEAGSSEATPIRAQRPLLDATHAAGEGLEFLQMLGSVLCDWDTDKRDDAIVVSLEKIGLTRAHGFRPTDLGEARRSAIVKGLKDGEAAVRAKTYSLGRKVNGWSINYLGPRFGDDYLLRAAVAMDQIYIVVPEEAVYPSGRVDSTGAQLDGHNNYRVRFDKGNLPPVSAFWSITLYFAKGFMVPNSINRWAIGDRTPGLEYNSDGSLDILIQHDQPDGEHACNWLPAPEEPFMLLLRLYLPRDSVLRGEWLPPPIVRVKV